MRKRVSGWPCHRVVASHNYSSDRAARGQTAPFLFSAPRGWACSLAVGKGAPSHPRMSGASRLPRECQGSCVNFPVAISGKGQVVVHVDGPLLQDLAPARHPAPPWSLGGLAHRIQQVALHRGRWTPSMRLVV